MNSFRIFGIVLIMLLMCVSCGTTKKAEANIQADDLYGQKLDIDSLEMNSMLNAVVRRNFTTF